MDHCILEIDRSSSIKHWFYPSLMFMWNGWSFEPVLLCFCFASSNPSYNFFERHFKHLIVASSRFNWQFARLKCSIWVLLNIKLLLFGILICRDDAQKNKFRFPYNHFTFHEIVFVCLLMHKHVHNTVLWLLIVRPCSSYFFEIQLQPRRGKHETKTMRIEKKI